LPARICPLIWVMNWAKTSFVTVKQLSWFQCSCLGCEKSDWNHNIGTSVAG
jgi:hypothetical protein